MANRLGVGSAANQNVAAAVNDNTRYQAQWFTQAATQRETIIAQNAQLIAQNAALVAALGRGSAMPVQNGTFQVGSIDWASIQQAVGGVR